MNLSKAVGIVTAGIPIVGILIGGITFGINFKTDVQHIKEDVANQAVINTDVEQRFAELPPPYNDTLVWSTIDNIYIPDIYNDNELRTKVQNLALQVTELSTEFSTFDINIYDDSSVTNRLQDLAIELTALSTEFETLELGELYDDTDLRGRIAELEGSLQALANMELHTDGEVDIGPLIVRTASLEGSVESFRTSLDSVRGDIRTLKSDVNSVERVANSAKTVADAAQSSSGGSRTIENNYDDSNLRDRISTLERQINTLSTTSSDTTIQRVENPFDDASIRADISRLQNAIAILQATPDISYDDSDLRNIIDDIQWELDNIEIPTATTTDTVWLEDLIYEVKHELTDRIQELSILSTSTGDGVELWMVQDLQSQVINIQEQVWELQEIANSYTDNNNNNSGTTSTNTTEGRSWEGSWNEPYWIYIEHVDSNGNHTYTGDYFLDGYWNGEPVWVNWECGTPGGQWEYCYVFKYNYTSWVLQPLPPSTEWLANSYNDNGLWPWEGSWSGDVDKVEVRS